MKYNLCKDNVMCCDDNCQACAQRIYEQYMEEKQLNLNNILIHHFEEEDKFRLQEDNICYDNI